MARVNDIRSTFLNYFRTHDHAVVDSAPLVPRNDPTLMFVNSGMVQFRNLFTGMETRDYRRATSAQKCVRAGGKHNDLDNVGYTARHHTFFEMLGNFSFGDYFKAEAIPFAWDLITRDFGIDKARLYATVWHEDEEAFGIWKKVGIPEDRIIRIATPDNFWQMGPVGPCGPCTEIFYDHGAHIRGGPPGSPDENGDRFIEIWNIVFMQNELFADGSMCRLDMQSIDTGMGIERIAALLQGSHDNYDTDLFKALIEACAHVTGVEPYGDRNVHHRVIADHLRSISFLIADNVLPANEGRGYVLRRIMRRAMRHAHLLGTKDPVMHRLVPELVRQMGQAYPELGRAQTLIGEALLLEETRFRATLDRGLSLLEAELATLAENADLPGETAFKLYDTYGFPLDLTQDVLREKGHAVDSAGFDAAMKAQKARARAAWAGSGATADDKVWFDLSDRLAPTEFLGYDSETAEAVVLAIVSKNREVTELGAEGGKGQVVMNQTPFYAESGGQLADHGRLVIRTGSHDNPDTRFIGNVSDVRKVAGGLFAHYITCVRGVLRAGAPVLAEVDHARRRDICASHSATHLLHEALRRRLGNHVAQRGSLNAPDRLRFDFSHQKALSPEQLENVEKEVNRMIRQNGAVETRVMTPDKARRLGARALFGERYGDEVRVVAMGCLEGSGRGCGGNTYALELCGGTHVRNTGAIGAFVVLGDSASGAGVRRIEALTGQAALDYLRTRSRHLAEAASALKTGPEGVLNRIRALQDERRRMQAEIENLRRQAVLGGGTATAAEQLGNVRFLGQALEGVPASNLRPLIDDYKSRIGSGVVVLISDTGGKAAVAAGVTEDLTGRISAVDLVQVAAAALGGKGGGGRPDMAQAGGPLAKNTGAALQAVRTYLGDK
ncbi:MAG: alanine--tRNA ligase [Rhodobacteraceae bacterium]|nr:alanine--tRNA ligase [Paracoccaceae bacterium]